jgi:hypothetical protein
MNERDDEKLFRTLRGFIRGEEPDEPMYFAYSATLRVHGEDLPFDEITRRLQVQPTRTHRKGGRPKPTAKTVYRDDAWHFQPPLAETEPLHRHIDALWAVVRPHVDYVKSLKQRYKVDVFCGYRSNCDHAGIEVPHSSLELFTSLEVPFGVSIIIA